MVMMDTSDPIDKNRGTGVAEAVSDALPDAVRDALLEILSQTLTLIRALECRERMSLLADHAHNIPQLLKRPPVSLFHYYWETERPCFVDAMRSLDQPPPAPFLEPWRVLSAHYDSLRSRRAD